MRGWLARRLPSLTSRLVLTTMVLAVAVSVLIGTVTTLAVRAYLTDQLDDNVHASLQGARTFGVGRPEPNLIGGPGRDVGSIEAQWSGDGESAVGRVTTQRADGEPDVDYLSAEQLAQLTDLPADESIGSVRIDDLGSFRVGVAETRDGSAVVAVGIGTSNVDEAVANLIWWEVLLALVAVAGAGGAAAIVVRRQLRPLREVAATAHTVAGLPLESGAADIPARVPTHLTDERTEVGQVGAALNTLLAHVETSLTARHRSEQQVRQFVADASHELRTPLSTIAGYSELARRRPEDESALRTALAKVDEESRRMTSLVEDLLLLARLDAGRPLADDTVDLTNVLLETVTDAQVLAPDHRWRLDLPDEAVEVRGDEQRLHQVVTNLLTNARKHTPPGTTVTVTAGPWGFSVHDDGPGFAPELADHAFERFTRGDPARQREGGAGLGLALAAAIVGALGGEVDLESRPGDTTVSIRLRTLRPTQHSG